MFKKMYSMLALVMVLSMILTACASTASPSTGSDTPADLTLKVLVHQNPPMVAFMEEFNKKFEEKYPYITVDMSVVNANDLSTVTQTRLTANDVDLVDMFGFANAAQPYMSQVDAPNWQAVD